MCLRLKETFIKKNNNIIIKESFTAINFRKLFLISFCTILMSFINLKYTFFQIFHILSKNPHVSQKKHN